MRPCIVFLDELDAVVGTRSMEGSGGAGEAAGVQQVGDDTLGPTPYSAYP